MPLRTICVYLGAFLGASWPVLGPSWAILGQSWAILGPSWGYLGLLGAILSYLGAILETRVFKRAPAGSACCGPSPRCAHVSNWTRSVSYCGNFGVHSGAQNWVIFALFWSYFLEYLFDDFRTTLGVISGDQICPRRGQNGTKRAIESFKDPQSCICKHLTNHLFFGFLGSRDLAREP